MSRHPNLRQLHYFAVVAETLSFRAASLKLNIAQSAISRAVRDLEISLGQPLLERTTRHVKLTSQGGALSEGLSRARREIDVALREVEQIAAGERGELMVGYSATATHGPMSQLLLAFKTRQPHATIRLRLLATIEQIEPLRSGGIDFGFLLSAGIPDDLDYVEIARDQLVALVPETHQLAKRSSIPLSALRSEPFVIGTPERWKVFRAIVENSCMNSGFLPSVVAEAMADDVPLLLEMVASGQGVTLYGSSIRHSLPPGIVMVPLEGGSNSFGISIAWRSGIEKTLPLARLLIDFIRRERSPTQSGE